MVAKKDDSVILNEEEVQAAESEMSAAEVSIYTRKLKKPVIYSDPATHQDVECTELHFDFERLTGNDSLAIERELQILNRPVVVRELSGEFQIRVAVRACKEPISVDLLRSLSMKDCNAIMNKAKSFLLAAE